MGGASFGTRFTGTRQCGGDMLASRLPFLRRRVGRRGVSTFGCTDARCNIKSTLGSKIGSGLGKVTALKAIHFGAIRAPGCLILDKGDLRLFSASARKRVSQRLIFGRSHLRGSELARVPVRKRMGTRTRTQKGGMGTCGLSLRASSGPVRLVVCSYLVFAGVPRVPASPRRAMRTVIVNGSFLGRLNSECPGLGMSLPVFDWEDARVAKVPMLTVPRASGQEFTGQ